MSYNSQCSPFLSVQQVKEFLKPVKHLQVSLPIMSAERIVMIWNKKKCLILFHFIHCQIVLPCMKTKIRVW